MHSDDQGFVHAGARTVRLLAHPPRLRLDGIPWRVWAMDEEPALLWDRWDLNRFPGLTLEDLEPGARELRVHRELLDHLDPRVAALARRFHPLARWNVYRRLLVDPRGHLAALVDSCPAILIHDAALALYSPDADDPSRISLTISAARAGHPLRQLLQIAVHEWQAFVAEQEDEAPAPYLAPTASGDGTPAPRWGPALPGLTRPPARSLGIPAFKAQVRLYRASPATLAPDLLLTPPPRVSDAEIPTDPEVFCRWRALHARVRQHFATQTALDSVGRFVAENGGIVLGDRSLDEAMELVDALVELAGRGKLPVGKTAEAVIEAAQAQATEVIDLDHVEARILARLIQADPPEEP